MSRIRADRVTDRAGTGPVEITYGANITGVTTAAHLNVTGICTATSFEGSGANLTGICTATSFEGSGANLTGLPEGTNVLKAMLFS